MKMKMSDFFLICFKILTGNFDRSEQSLGFSLNQVFVFWLKDWYIDTTGQMQVKVGQCWPDFDILVLLSPRSSMDYYY